MYSMYVWHRHGAKINQGAGESSKAVHRERCTQPRGSGQHTGRHGMIDPPSTALERHRCCPARRELGHERAALQYEVGHAGGGCLVRLGQGTCVGDSQPQSGWGQGRIAMQVAPCLERGQALLQRRPCTAPNAWPLLTSIIETVGGEWQGAAAVVWDQWPQVDGRARRV